MSKLALVSVIFFNSFFLSAQERVSWITETDLELRITRIERIISGKKRRLDTAYVVNFKILNQSPDTVVIFTNGCPSYRQFSFSSPDSSRILNKGVFCSHNTVKEHILASKQSFKFRERIGRMTESFNGDSLVVAVSVPIGLYNRSKDKFFNILNLKWYEKSFMISSQRGYNQNFLFNQKVPFITVRRDKKR